MYVGATEDEIDVLRAMLDSLSSDDGVPLHDASSPEEICQALNKAIRQFMTEHLQTQPPQDSEFVSKAHRLTYRASTALELIRQITAHNEANMDFHALAPNTPLDPLDQSDEARICRALRCIAEACPELLPVIPATPPSAVAWKAALKGAAKNARRQTRKIIRLHHNEKVTRKIAQLNAAMKEDPRAIYKYMRSVLKPYKAGGLHEVLHEGKVSDDPAHINAACCNHFGPLFSRVPVDIATKIAGIRIFLEEHPLQNPPTDVNLLARVSGPITRGEIEVCLKSLANGKAPGPAPPNSNLPAIPAEVYKLLTTTRAP